jgi:hypothetical protein
MVYVAKGTSGRAWGGGNGWAPHRETCFGWRWTVSCLFFSEMPHPRVFQPCLKRLNPSRKGLVSLSQWFCLLLSKNLANLSPRVFCPEGGWGLSHSGWRPSPLGLWFSNFPGPSQDWAHRWVFGLNLTLARSAPGVRAVCNSSVHERCWLIVLIAGGLAAYQHQGDDCWWHHPRRKKKQLVIALVCSKDSTKCF